MSNNDVIIYTDGSSRGNPGPGGYGIVMEDCKTGFSKQKNQIKNYCFYRFKICGGFC